MGTAPRRCGDVKHDKNVSNVSFRNLRICDRHRQTARGDFESVEHFGLGDLVSCKVGSSSSDSLGAYHSKYLIDSEWTYAVRGQKRPCPSHLTCLTSRHFSSRPFDRTSRAVRLDCHKKGLPREMLDQFEPTGSTSSCKGPPTVRRRGGRGYCGRAQAGFALRDKEAGVGALKSAHYSPNCAVDARRRSRRKSNKELEPHHAYHIGPKVLRRQLLTPARSRVRGADHLFSQVGACGCTRKREVFPEG